MRDILVTLLVFGTLPFIFKRPYIGVLVWSWLSYMNPHRLTWGFAYDMPFAQIVAAVLILSLLINKDKQTVPVNKTTVFWLLFLVWMTIATAAAIEPGPAWEYFARIVKIQLVTFFTIMLITEKKRVDLLIWVIALSIGFFSIKGGLFTILTGGGFRVYGPYASFIGENNALALATLMVIPLMYYLSKTADNKWARRFMLAGALLSLASALGSQSRGALVAVAAVGIYFWWQSNSKLISAALLTVLLAVGFVYMPESWHERMSTIQNYEEDESAMSRIYAWTYSINVANDRITGGGLKSWSAATYALYSPDATSVHVAHSIYFSVLADSGWIGLLLFLIVFWLTWRNLSRVIKASEPKSDLALLARMTKVSLVAYFSGGAFLSLSYFDLPWHLVALAVLLTVQVSQPEWQSNPVERRKARADEPQGHRAVTAKSSI